MFLAITIEDSHHLATGVAQLLNAHPGSVSLDVEDGWRLRTTEIFREALKTIDRTTRASYPNERAVSNLDPKL